MRGFPRVVRRVLKKDHNAGKGEGGKLQVSARRVRLMRSPVQLTGNSDASACVSGEYWKIWDDCGQSKGAANLAYGVCPQVTLARFIND
jgi:hypothetical protein